MTHTALDEGGAGTQRAPPEQVPVGLTGHARAWVPQAGGVELATPPVGAHDPVTCGAATVTAAARMVPHDVVAVWLVPVPMHPGAS